MKTTTAIRKRIGNTTYCYRQGRVKDGWGCAICETWFPHKAKVKRTFAILLIHKLLIHGQVGATSMGQQSLIFNAMITREDLGKRVSAEDWHDAYADAPATDRYPE